MKTIYRVPLIMLTATAAVSLGVVGVHASTQCVRFVQQKMQRHHKVSAATAARWAAWNKAHPNFHPKRTPQETIAQIDFACKVPVEQKASVTPELPKVEIAPFSLPVEFSTPPDGPPVVVATDTPPQELFPNEPGDDVVSPPIYGPQYPVMFGPIPFPAVSTPLNPPPVEPTPEPAGWVLMLTAAAAAGIVGMRRRESAAA